MSEENIITDNFSRRFPYLRLSLTDVCNFSCSYCLPDGYKNSSGKNFLSKNEIILLVKAMAELGTWKIRFTGGEPTLRKDFLEIISGVNEVSGIKKLAVTTNGYKLSKKAQEYYDAGLRAINISMDSLDPLKFNKITGHNRLSEVLNGIDSCFMAGFKKVKLNTVLLKDLNDNELENFIDFVADKPISLRFIELMQTGDNKDYFKKHHLSGTYLTEKLLNKGWQKKPREEGAGPAVEFYNGSSKGTIGLIAPYSKDFCKSCNRLRISANGKLHLCLFGQGGFSLREYLQNESQKEELKNRILELMKFKTTGHFLHDGKTGLRNNLSSIGG